MLIAMVYFCRMQAKTIFRSITLLAIVLLIAGQFPVSTDAGVYLAAARFTANGHVPYLHFPHAYTPLILGVHSLLYFALKQPPYWLFAALQCLIVAAVSLITYATLVKKLNLKPAAAYLLTGVQLAALLAMQAQSILSEPWVILFIWLSAFYLLPGAVGLAQIFTGGLFIGFAFLCKQYGIAALLPFTLLVASTKQYKAVLVLWLGTVLPVALCLLLFSAIGYNPSGVFKQWYAQNHQQIDTSGLFGMGTWLWGGKITLLLLLALAGMAVQHFLSQINKIPALAAVWLTGVAAMLTPTIFRHFDHYFMLPLPFIMLALAHYLPLTSGLWPPKIISLLAILFFLQFAGRQWQYRNLAYTQQQDAAKLAKIIPVGSRAYVPYNLSYLIVLNQYIYPFAEKSGFAFMKLSPEYFKAYADKNAGYISMQKLSGAIPLAMANADTIYLLKK